MLRLKVVFALAAVVDSVPVAPASIEDPATALGAPTAPRAHASVSLGQTSLGSLFAHALKSAHERPTAVASTAEGKLLEAEESVKPTDPAQTGTPAPSAGATLADTIVSAVQAEDLSSLTGDGRRS